jgi:hypothetical protein
LRLETKINNQQVIDKIEKLLVTMLRNRFFNEFAIRNYRINFRETCWLREKDFYKQQTKKGRHSHSYTNREMLIKSARPGSQMAWQNVVLYTK